MKHCLKYKVIIAAAALALSGCSMDILDNYPNGNGEFITAFGTISSNDSQYTITLDDKSLLYIDCLGSQTSWEEVRNSVDTQNGRVFFNYSVIDSNQTTVSVTSTVRLNKFYSLLVKPVVRMSTLSDAERAELGNEPIKAVSANIGGGYVNLCLSYLYNLTDIETLVHRVNLVMDDVNYDDGDIHLVLYHHSQSPADYNTASTTTMWASFGTGDLIPSDRNNAIKLYWSWYDNNGKLTQYSDLAIFKPYATLGQSVTFTGDQPWQIFVE